MNKANSVSMYPKVTQEQVLSVAHIINSALQDPSYLHQSSYSQLMQNTIKLELDRIKKLFEKGKVTVSDSGIIVPPLATHSDITPDSDYSMLTKEISQTERQKIIKDTETRMRQELAAEWEKLNSAKSDKEMAKEDAEIKQMFSSLSENLDQRPEEYRDQFGILIRVEKMIRSIERIAKHDATPTAKLQATTKLMDYQDQQMSILERLMKIEKVNKIESVTRKFFLELRKHPELSVVADRYLHLLNEIE